MNLQKYPHGIEWTRVWGRTGLTWNPIAGCRHNCVWRSREGRIVECYAKRLAERGVAKMAYPEGFEHHYFHADRLDAPLKKKEPCGIFAVSMGDPFGVGVPDDDIEAVLRVMDEAWWHVFQMLTKNPKQVARFRLPENIWMGMSSPAIASFNELRAIDLFTAQLRYMFEWKAHVRFLSLEPLWFDAGKALENCLLQMGALPVEWVIVGALSDGKWTEQPRAKWVQRILDICDELGIPVFFKGNMIWPDWRDAFPVVDPGLPYARMDGKTIIAGTISPAEAALRAHGWGGGM